MNFHGTDVLRLEKHLILKIEIKCHEEIHQFVCYTPKVKMLEFFVWLVDMFVIPMNIQIRFTCISMASYATSRK